MPNSSRILSSLAVTLLAVTSVMLAQNVPGAPGMSAPTQPTVKCKKQNGCPKKQQKQAQKQQKKAQKQAQKQQKQMQKQGQTQMQQQGAPANAVPQPAPSSPT